MFSRNFGRISARKLNNFLHDEVSLSSTIGSHTFRHYYPSSKLFRQKEQLNIVGPYAIVFHLRPTNVFRRTYTKHRTAPKCHSSLHLSRFQTFIRLVVYRATSSSRRKVISAKYDFRAALKFRERSRLHFTQEFPPWRRKYQPRNLATLLTYAWSSWKFLKNYDFYYYWKSWPISQLTRSFDFTANLFETKFYTLACFHHRFFTSHEQFSELVIFGVSKSPDRSRDVLLLKD